MLNVVVNVIGVVGFLCFLEATNEIDNETDLLFQVPNDKSFSIWL